MSFDVAVIGAGPAGSTCASGLARAGLTVAVLDRAEPPRYKTCGGGLIGRARGQIELDLGPTIERECHVAEMRLMDADLSFEVRRSRPMVSMTMRADLDRRLIQAAQHAGARLMAPCELRGLTTTATGLLIETASGAVRARYAVAADGALSPTARAAGWPENPHNRPAIESEIEVSESDRRRLGGSALFDLGIPSDGYSWVFPKSEHLSVGTLSGRGARGLRRTLESYLKRIGLQRIIGRSDHGFVIPVAPRHTVLARDRVLLTGDAAGLADPVICEGITHAIASGRLAAEAIISDPARPEHVHREYHRLLRGEILSELRLARVLSRLLYGSERVRLALFQHLGRPMCEAMAEVITGRHSYRSLLLRPSNYLRLLVALARGKAVA